jgi:serine phosphatase RsbU (regulator of sigma subunit)
MIDASPEIIEKTKKSKTYNILYVDDEYSNLRIFRMGFKRHYNVFTAENGIEAIEILRSENIHLIITDQKMPEMTGTQLLEQTMEEFPDIIRIILTGFADIEAIVRAVNKCGIYKYITKPYDQGEMKLTIDKALETFSLRQEKQDLIDQLASSNAELARANEALEEKVQLRTKELKTANSRLTDGLKYAQTVQNSLIPSDEKLNQFFGEAFSVYLPLDHVSGDFYWFKQIDENRAVFAVLDCMGHGMAGALLSMVADTQLNQLVVDKKIYQPDKILGRMDENLLKSVNQQDGHETIDAAAFFIDKNKGVLKYAGARLGFVYYQAGKQLKVKGTKKSLGSKWKEVESYEVHSFKLSELEELYIYTDGILDQMDHGFEQKFGSRRLLNLIDDVHRDDLMEQKEALLNAYSDWKKDQDQIDDITLIGIRIK